jgi:hypothetical protein
MLLENIQRARIRSSQRQQQQDDEEDDEEEAAEEEAALASSASLDEGDFCAQLQAGRANRLVSAKIRRQLQKQQQHRGRQGSGDSRQQFEEGKILLIASDNVLAFAEHMASIAGLEDLLCAYPIASTLYAGNKIDASAATEGAIARIQSVRGCTYIHTIHTHSSLAVHLTSSASRCPSTTASTHTAACSSSAPATSSSTPVTAGESLSIAWDR